MKSDKENSIFEILSNMLEGNVDVSANISDSKLWFALHHPKACSLPFYSGYMLFDFR